ncbi:hypothetical protein CERZMDRAFT_18631, partial [Cercospora zeae-maydis SCOH1-5]
ASINETRAHREILRIYTQASKLTRPIYELGYDVARPVPEKLVICWMLWHVCRYRDQR